MSILITQFPILNLPLSTACCCVAFLAMQASLGPGDLETFAHSWCTNRQSKCKECAVGSVLMLEDTFDSCFDAVTQGVRSRYALALETGEVRERDDWQSGEKEITASHDR